MQDKETPRLTNFYIPHAGPASEFSEEFVRMMSNRMVFSYHKYGAVAEAKLDNLACIDQRLQKYIETGNTEWLVDVGNFAMIEFMHPKHPNAHFEATDSDESPGRTFADGTVSRDPNLKE